MEKRKIVKLSEDSLSLVLLEEGKYSYNFLYHLIMPLIDSYWIAYTFFSLQSPNLETEMSEMIDKIQWNGENLYVLGFCTFQESPANHTLKKAVVMFLEQGFLQKRNDAPKNKSERWMVSLDP